MLHIDVTLEDTRAVLRRNHDTAVWEGEVMDALTGETAAVAWTDNQLAHVLATGIAPDDMTAAFYEVAESAVAGMPQILRLIP